MVLVDSTVWIDLLRDTDSPPVAVLRGLLQDGDAAVAPVIVQEVLQGAVSAAALAELEARFLGLPLLEARPAAATHAGAAALYARCRWRGVTPRSPHDCLIAQIAIEHAVALLHDDRDFEHLARVDSRLELYRTPRR